MGRQDVAVSWKGPDARTWRGWSSATRTCPGRSRLGNLPLIHMIPNPPSRFAATSWGCGGPPIAFLGTANALRTTGAIMANPSTITSAMPTGGDPGLTPDVPARTRLLMLTGDADEAP